MTAKYPRNLAYDKDEEKNELNPDTFGLVHIEREISKRMFLEES